MSTTAMEPTRLLAVFAAGLRYDDLTDAERRAAGRHLLDTIGACLSGASSRPTRLAAGLADEIGRTGNVPVPGLPGRYDVLTSAWLCGTSAHGLEVDDGYRAGSVHPGAVVVPAVLAAAFGQGMSGERMIAAIAVGYEFSTRLAEAIHPASRLRGFHNTPVVGVLAAAAAVGSLRGQSADCIEQGLGIAASSAAGLFAFLTNGGEIKRLHAGFAAREGLQAALLAERGMTGPTGVLESADGFFQAYGGQPITEALTRGLHPRLDGVSLNITRCYLKPYACCRHIHPAVDAVLDIARTERFSPASVARVQASTYAIAAKHAHLGGWGDMAAAQMNYQFCVATALRHGDVAISRFQEAELGDPLTNALCERIAVDVDAECQQTYPALRAAKLSLTLEDGRSFERYVDEPSGSARHPLSDAAVVEKYRGLAGPVLGQERTEASISLLGSLARLNSVDGLVEELAATGDAA